MADVTDPRAIKYVNEVVRPYAEKLRGLKAELSSINSKWSSEISDLIPNDASPISDGRENEGISRLTGTDVNDLLYGIGLLSTQLNNIAIQVIEKPCVRTLQTT